MQERRSFSLSTGTDEALRPVVYLGNVIWRSNPIAEARKEMSRRSALKILRFLADKYSGPGSRLLGAASKRQARGVYQQPDVES